MRNHKRYDAHIEALVTINNGFPCIAAGIVRGPDLDCGVGEAVEDLEFHTTWGATLHPSILCKMTDRERDLAVEAILKEFHS